MSHPSKASISYGVPWSLLEVNNGVTINLLPPPISLSPWEWISPKSQSASLPWGNKKIKERVTFYPYMWGSCQVPFPNADMSVDGIHLLSLFTCRRLCWLRFSMWNILQGLKDVESQGTKSKSGLLCLTLSLCSYCQTEKYQLYGKKLRWKHYCM